MRDFSFLSFLVLLQFERLGAFLFCLPLLIVYIDKFRRLAFNMPFLRFFLLLLS